MESTFESSIKLKMTTKLNSRIIILLAGIGVAIYCAAIVLRYIN